jgi:pyrroloquinoline-quinone synthase
VHESADVEHSGVCRDLLNRLPQAERAEAIAAGEELAGALWNFLSGVEARVSIQRGGLAAAVDGRRAL